MALIDDILAQQSGGEPGGFEQLMERLKMLFTGGDPNDGRTQPAPRAPISGTNDVGPRPVEPRPSPAPAARAANYSGGASDFFDALQGKDPKNTNAAISALMQLSPDMSPQMARALATNPALAQILLPSLVTTGQKPDIIEVPGAYGQNTKMVWDRRKGKLVPLSTVMDEGAAAGLPPSISTGTAGYPAADTSPAAPMASNPASGGAQQPQMSDQARQLIESIKRRGAPLGMQPTDPGYSAFAQEAPQAPAAAAPAQMGTQPAPSEGLDTSKYAVGQAVPKPPEGYVHALAPNGSGYLYDRRTRQPVFEPKSELEARSRVGEKRADELREQQRQVQGVESIIGNARKAPERAGFKDALALGNLSFDLSIPVPGTSGGRLGGDVLSPFEYVGRNLSPDNPKWGALQDLRSTQRSLELLVARPLMKGQGQVTDSERSMITEAIGALGKATSVADYQFRLNQIDSMIRAMNQPGTGNVAVAAANPHRPTLDELAAVWDREGGMREDVLKSMSDKYHVSRGDLQDYVIDLYRASGRGR